VEPPRTGAPLTPGGGVLRRRHNPPFTQWPAAFADDQVLVAAMLDRPQRLGRWVDALFLVGLTALVGAGFLILYAVV